VLAIDPYFERTILIRNKLDKYYRDLTTENVNAWVNGSGDLPDYLVCFALTLPWWQDGQPAPKTFARMRDDFNSEDLREMQLRSLNPKYISTIGFKNFTMFMEKKVEPSFMKAIGLVLAHMRRLCETIEARVGERKCSLAQCGGGVSDLCEPSKARNLRKNRDAQQTVAGCKAFSLMTVLDLAQSHAQSFVE